MNTRIIFLFFFLNATFLLFSQEDLLNQARQQEYLHPETALLLVASRAGTFTVLELPANPLEKLEEIGIIVPAQIRWQLNESPTSEQWTSAGAFSFLVTQLYDIPGGMFYSLMPGAHYASKELQYLNLLPLDMHHGEPISGTMATSILDRVDLMLENGDIR